MESSNRAEVVSYHQLLTLSAIQGYKLLISPSKGSQCPSNPSCSSYGFTAFQTHDPLTAYMMTADRLHRCGHDVENYEIEEIEGVYRYIDSVDFKGKKYKEEPAILLNQFNYIPATISGNDTLILTEDGRLFSFANSLANKQDYSLAEIEYKRFSVYFPASRFYNSTQKSLAYTLYRNDKFLEAINLSQLILENSEDKNNSDEIRFLLGICYFKVDNLSLAEGEFSKLLNSGNDLVRNKSFLMNGIIAAKKQEWNEAETNFNQVIYPSLEKKRSEFLKLVNEGKKLSPISPSTAGFLSLVPGLGYFYSGYSQTGLSALIVNSAFFLATYEAFKTDNKSLGSILGFISLGWYTGNIYGSVVSAERQNEFRLNSILQKFSVDFH